MRRALLLVLAACTSGDPAPTVSIISASPQMLTPANDLENDLRILVTYEDRDGDLGQGVARIQDCRAEELVTDLELPAIAPADKIGSKIDGSIDLSLDDVGAAQPAALPATCAELGVELAAGSTVFCVQLVDAGGHVGPGDCTSAIALE